MRADPDKHDELETEVSPHRSSPNNTPLLTASLNAPPQTYYAGLNGNVRVKCPTDLSNKTKRSEDAPYSDSTSQGLSSHSSSNHQAVFYSTLLKQLRQKAGDNGGSYQQYVVPIKIKKEKGGKKPLPFMCPACKKRFQRQIAMNSHFQNEHISESSPSGSRSCKLCGHSAPSMSVMRSHLLTSHKIDLDKPSPVASPIHNPQYSLLEASLRSGSSQEEAEPSCSNIDMSSSRSNTPTSSEQSPERSLAKPEEEDETSMVEDLSLRRTAPQSPSSKRQRVVSPRRSPSPPAGGQLGRFCCCYCNISYPDQTLHFLHMGFHSESNPWKCSRCGHQASDLHDFNTHLYIGHQ